MLTVCFTWAALKVVPHISLSCPTVLEAAIGDMVKTSHLHSIPFFFPPCDRWRPSGSLTKMASVMEGHETKVQNLVPPCRKIFTY